jgi:hypothetical protein
MLTHDRIEQVRRHTHVSTMEATHALCVSGGDVTRAIEELNGHPQAGERAVVVTNRAQAQRLAGALVESGIWFECEATACGEWRFSVAPGAYARLRTLHDSLRLARDEPLSVAA